MIKWLAFSFWRGICRQKRTVRPWHHPLVPNPSTFSLSSGHEDCQRLVSHTWWSMYSNVSLFLRCIHKTIFIRLTLIHSTYIKRVEKEFVFNAWLFFLLRRSNKFAIKIECSREKVFLSFSWCRRRWIIFKILWVQNS